ncbi:hypothetical protein DFR44_14210 [Hydromonas duriensis]|uniref:Uncharacterized protein n=2 Tax=Hydromonas duriensis TaxID=1527608 RepID=A0A4V3DJE4_9BURK|nr:hypothetical protein DFR44_14210 [Hydromonas duriensis]
MLMFGLGLSLYFPPPCETARYCNEWAQMGAVLFAFPVSLYFAFIYSAFHFQWRIRWYLVAIIFLAIFGFYVMI